MLTKEFRQSLCSCFAREVEVPEDILKGRNKLSFWQGELEQQLNKSFLPVCRVIAYIETMEKKALPDQQHGRFCAYRNKKPYILPSPEYQQVLDLAQKKQKAFHTLTGSRRTQGVIILRVALALHFSLDETNAALISNHCQPLLDHRILDQIFVYALRSHWSEARYEEECLAYQKWIHEKKEKRNESDFFQVMKEASDHAAKTEAEHPDSAFLTVFIRNQLDELLQDESLDEETPIYQRLYDLMASGERAANGAARRTLLKTVRWLCPDFKLELYGFEDKLNTCRKLHFSSAYALLYEAAGGEMPQPMPSTAQEAGMVVKAVTYFVRAIFRNTSFDSFFSGKAGSTAAEPPEQQHIDAKTSRRLAPMIVYRILKRMLSLSQNEKIKSLWITDNENEEHVSSVLRKIATEHQINMEKYDEPEKYPPSEKELLCALFYLLVLCDCGVAVRQLQNRVCEMMRFFGVKEAFLNEQQIKNRIGDLLFSSRPAADSNPDSKHSMESREPTYRFLMMLCIYVYGNRCDIACTIPSKDDFRAFLYNTLKQAWPGILDVIVTDPEQVLDYTTDLVNNVFNHIDQTLKSITNPWMQALPVGICSEQWLKALSACLKKAEQPSPFQEETITYHSWALYRAQAKDET